MQSRAPSTRRIRSNNAPNNNSFREFTRKTGEDPSSLSTRRFTDPGWIVSSIAFRLARTTTNLDGAAADRRARRPHITKTGCGSPLGLTKATTGQVAAHKHENAGVQEKRRSASASELPGRWWDNQPVKRWLVVVVAVVVVFGLGVLAWGLATKPVRGPFRCTAPSAVDSKC